MDIKSISNEQKEIMIQASQHIEAIAAILNNYEPCKEGEYILMKLQEAVHWLSTLMASVPLKSPQNEEPSVIIQ